MRWQLFEMEFEGQPEVIRRVAKLVVEDSGFASKLQQGVKKRQDWLRDTAGIIFRFHGMYKEGELVGRNPRETLGQRRRGDHGAFRTKPTSHSRRAFLWRLVHAGVASVDMRVES